MRVYFIRHGESETNLSKKWTGWMNVSLTEKGIEDAKKAGEFLKDISFDKVFSSDLDRARITAQTALPNAEIDSSALLREINVGNISGHPFSVISDEERAFALMNGYKRYGGESKEEFYERISAFKEELAALELDTVAVFTHAGLMRGMLDTVINARLTYQCVACNNCAVSIFDYTNGVWSLHSWINLT